MTPSAVFLFVYKVSTTLLNCFENGEREMRSLALLFAEVVLSVVSNRTRWLEKVPTNSAYGWPGAEVPEAVEQAMGRNFRCPLNDNY